MPSQSEIREQVPQQIIAALESDLLPWRRPWRASGGSQPARHSNVITRRPYQGVNPLLIELHALRLGLASRWWATFNQWHDLGCRVSRRPSDVQEGHWGCRLVFWKPLTRTIVDEQTGEEEEDERFFVLRYFTVFSGDQIEGEPAGQYQVHEDDTQTDAEPDYQPAEELISATGADIRYGGDRAYYRRPTPDGSFPNHREGDFIVLPPRATFDPPGAFYESIAHELAHWAEPRTGWDHAKQGYALGELVAEIASSYLSAELGVPQGETLENHASYLRSWLDAMKGDRNYIFRASRQASKVTDFLLSFARKPEPEAVATG